jgi:hypothetical protein
MSLDSKSLIPAIVLTGTIVPNTDLYTKYINPQQRRQEYLDALYFYSQFGRVYFLENSSYPLENDADFQHIPNVVLRKLPISAFPQKGKGFQEFEMLDCWVAQERDIPHSWLKVTGRYIYFYFQEIYNECLSNPDKDLIINQYLFSKWSDTGLFFIETDYYRKNIAGLYSKCNDRDNLFVEAVLFDRLKSLNTKEFKRFSNHLICTGIAGHTGKKIQNKWRDVINSRIREFNYIFDKRYIWFSL